MCIQELLAQLESYNPGFGIESAKSHRVQCFNHILNLSAKAFFKADYKGLLISFSTKASSIEDEQYLLQAWRRKGPVGKLHNIVHFVRKTPQCKAAFQAIATRQVSPEAIQQVNPLLATGSSGIKLYADNKTR